MLATEILSFDSPHYPLLLKEIHKPPKQLYYQGNSELLSHPHLLAVVGSRRANEYGRRAASKILPPLVNAGIILVSGLAHGIDSLAHKASVDAGRPTIAVLGSGLNENVIYPQSNVKLAQEILKNNGLLLSEYPSSTKALLYHFPARNRIVAGICKAVFIMQAAEKSGSLITARLGLETNREVCVLPGQITDSLAAGTNKLLQDGARCILEPQDLLDIFAISPEKAVAKTVESVNLSFDQTLLLKKLSDEPLPIDLLIQETRLSAGAVSAALLELELTGIVEQLPGMRYIRTT